MRFDRKELQKLFLDLIILFETLNQPDEDILIPPQKHIIKLLKFQPSLNIHQHLNHHLSPLIRTLHIILNLIPIPSSSSIPNLNTKPHLLNHLIQFNPLHLQARAQLLEAPPKHSPSDQLPNKEHFLHNRISNQNKKYKYYKRWSLFRKPEEPTAHTSARVTLNTKSLNTKRAKSLSSLKAEEDTTTSKRDSEVRRNQSSRKRPRSLRRSPSSSSAPNASKRDSCALEEPSLSSSTKKRRHNDKNLGFIFLRNFWLDLNGVGWMGSILGFGF